MSVHDNLNDELQQQLLELIYDLLPEDEAVDLRRRIESDPEVALAYADAERTVGLFADAARITVPRIELEHLTTAAVQSPVRSEAAILPLPRAASDSKTARINRRLRWTAGLAAAILAAITLGGFLMDLVGRLGIESKHLQMTVAGPKELEPGIDNLFTITTNSPTGKPLATAITYTLHSHNGQSLINNTESTDANGRLTVKLRPNMSATDGAGPATFEVAAADMDQPTRLQATLAVKEQSLATQVSLDKPLYQPGETLRYRSLTLTRFGLEPAGPMPVQFEIRDPSGALVANSGVEIVTEHGVAAGEFVVPADLAGGQYTLSAASPSGVFAPAKRTFFIRQYRLERFKKDLEFTRDSYAPGDRVAADLAVDRAEGGPAAGAKLRVIATVDGRMVCDTSQSAGPDGKARIEFQLPAQIARGDGQLAIVVDDGGAKETVAKTIRINLGRVELSFYPEGGDLVAGLKNRVYFVGRNPLGKPIHVEGHIVDLAGREVARVETGHKGMGSFEFEPAAGDSYSLKVSKPDGVTDQPKLPPLNTERHVLLTTGPGVFEPKQPLALDLLCDRDRQSLAVAAYCRGVLVGQQIVLAQKGTNHVEIPLAPEVGGVVRVTAYEQNGRGLSPFAQSAEQKGTVPLGVDENSLVPVAERLVYRRPERKLNVKVADHPAQYAPGDPVELSLAVTNERGEPTPAVLGVAVVPDALMKMVDDETPGMATHFYLTTEIEKPEDLEKADFYLSDDSKAPAALDLLLGTQGWRRFIEKPADDPALAGVPLPFPLEGEGPGVRGSSATSADLTRLATMGELGGPPLLFDNRAEARRAFAADLERYDELRGRQRHRVGQIILFTAVPVLLMLTFVAGWGAARGPRFWAPTLATSAACLIVGLVWVQNKSDESGTIALVTPPPPVTAPTPSDANPSTTAQVATLPPESRPDDGRPSMTREQRGTDSIYFDQRDFYAAAMKTNVFIGAGEDNTVRMVWRTRDLNKGNTLALAYSSPPIGSTITHPPIPSGLTTGLISDTTNIAGIEMGGSNDPFAFDMTFDPSLLPPSSSLDRGALRTSGSQADFDELIELITSTIAPETWERTSGGGSIPPFETNLTLVVDQQGQSIKTGSGTLDIDAAPTLNSGNALLVSGGTLRFKTNAGSPVISGGQTVTVASGATLELGGSVSALASGTNSLNIANNSPASSGGMLLVSGSGQSVGTIDGSGTADTLDFSDLSSSRIRQNALTINGTGSSFGTVTVRQSGPGESNPINNTNFSGNIATLSVANNSVPSGGAFSAGNSGVGDGWIVPPGNGTTALGNSGAVTVSNGASRELQGGVANVLAGLTAGFSYRDSLNLRGTGTIAGSVSFDNSSVNYTMPGGTLDTNGLGTTAGGLTKFGGGTLTAAAGAGSSQLAGTNTFSGAITNGADTLTLTNGNTYSGGTTITGGTLRVRSVPRAVVNNGNYDLFSNGTSAGSDGNGISGTSATFGALSLSGSPTFNVNNASGSSTGTGAAVINSGGTLGRNGYYQDPNVILNETQTGKVMLGVGVNSDAGLVGSVVIDEQNFDRGPLFTLGDVKVGGTFGTQSLTFFNWAASDGFSEKLDADYQSVADTNYKSTIGSHFYGRRTVITREYAHQHLPSQSDARTDFTETLYWHPLLITDAKGQAKIKFDLSDAVAKFRVMIDAHCHEPAAGEGRVGSGTGEVVARMPVSLEPKLPLEVNAGDRIDLPVAVTNESGGEMPVTVSVETEATDGRRRMIAPTSAIKTLIRLDGPRTQTLRLPAGSRGRAYFPLEVVGSAGVAPIEVRGEAKATRLGESSYGDAKRQAVSVVPAGFPVSASYSGNLKGKQDLTVSLPRDWIPGTLQVSLRAFPSTGAELMAGMDSILREPYGCFEQTSTANYPNILALEYLQEQKLANPELTRRARQLLATGYTRLSSFECGSGGFEWFGHDPGHAALTAYGLMEFREMARVYPVDPALIRRTTNWLLSRRNGRGGFLASSGGYHEIGTATDDVNDTYIVWALTEAGQAGIDREIDHAVQLGRESDDPYIVALAAASATNSHRDATAHELLDKLAMLQVADGHLDGRGSITASGGLSLEVEATALAALAWLKSPDHWPAARKAIEWIEKSRQGEGGFGSTQGTILALKALVENARVNRTKLTGGELMVEREGQPIDRHAFSSTEQDTILLDRLGENLGPGDNRISIKLTGDNQMPYALDVSFRSRTLASDPACPLRLSTRLAAREVKAGATVALDAELTNATNQPQPMSIAIIGLPAGLQPRANQLEELKKSGAIDYYETRAREVIFYWRSLDARQRVPLHLDLVAEWPGQYTAPASRAYLYYTAEQKQWAEPLAVTITHE